MQLKKKKNMKKYFLKVIVVVYLITTNNLFAQSRRDKYDVINSYFEIIVKKDSTKKIIVAKEKINNNSTIDIFKIKYIIRYYGKGNSIADNLLYNKTDWKKMQEKYKNNCNIGKYIWCNDDFWSENDFKYKKIVFESMNNNKGIELLVNKYDFDVCVYSFSEPIYYQNKNYLAFTFVKSYMTGSNTFVVIMKKIKGKWIQTHEASDPNTIN
jgi:hypothetical protein